MQHSKYMNNSDSMNTADKKGAIGITKEIVVPVGLVALVAGAGDSIVRKVRKGSVSTGPKAERVAKADELLRKGMEELLVDVREQLRNL